MLFSSVVNLQSNSPDYHTLKLVPQMMVQSVIVLESHLTPPQLPGKHQNVREQPIYFRSPPEGRTFVDRPVLLHRMKVWVGGSHGVVGSLETVRNSAAPSLKAQPLCGVYTIKHKYPCITGSSVPRGRAGFSASVPVLLNHRSPFGTA